MVDSISETVTLDKKGTIAIGNQLKEGTGYKELFKQQSELVDSLFKENSLRKTENQEYKNVIVPSLKESNASYERENGFLKEKMELQKQSDKARIKSLKGNFWKGIGIGALIGVLVALFGV